jgi:hypothetical protein
METLNEFGVAMVVSKYYSLGANKTQRLGQFFINHYLPANTVWPELFYEEDITKASMMMLNYLEQEK